MWTDVYTFYARISVALRLGGEEKKMIKKASSASSNVPEQPPRPVEGCLAEKVDEVQLLEAMVGREGEFEWGRGPDGRVSGRLQVFLSLDSEPELCVAKRERAAGVSTTASKAKAPASRKCPNCQAKIEKALGCNKMTCTHCNSHFCWLYCAPLLSVNPYKHFQPGQSECAGKLSQGLTDSDEEDFSI